ncbi:MAG: hypothetical protein ABL977_12380 [Candidatus Eisenbacteria bacterium]
MKKLAALCGLLTALVATPASATAGLNLRWSSCFADGGAIDRTSACSTSLATAGTVVGSFEISAPVAGARQLDFTVDLASAGTALPEWWRFNAPGGIVGCRGTALAVNTAVSGTAVQCFDWSEGQAVGAMQSYQVGIPAGPTTARLILSTGVLSPGLDLVPATEYFAFNLVLSNTKTTGTGSCAGCSTPMCVFIRQMFMTTEDGRSLGFGGSTHGTDSFYVTWQGGAGVGSLIGIGCPQATPARNSTWGAVKSLYH